MKPKCFFRGCDHKMETSIAKRNFPNAKQMKTTEIIECKIVLLQKCVHKVKKVCWYPHIREGQQSHKYAF